MLNAVGLHATILLLAASPAPRGVASEIELLRKDVEHHSQLTTEKLSAQDERLDAQDQRIGDLLEELGVRASWSVALLGSLITLVSIVAGFLAYFSSGHKARQHADEVLRAAKNDLDAKVSELQAKLREADAALKDQERCWAEKSAEIAEQQRTVAATLAKVAELEHNIERHAAHASEAINGHVQNAERQSRLLEQAVEQVMARRMRRDAPPAEESTKRVLRDEVARLAGGTGEPGYKALDARAFAAAADGKDAEAAEMWRQVVETPGAPKAVVARAMLNRAVALRLSNRPAESIEVVDELLARYQADANSDILESVSRSIGVRGQAQVDLKADVSETLSIAESFLNELQRRPRARRALAFALENCADLLGEVGRREEAERAYDEAIRRFAELGGTEEIASLKNSRGFNRLVEAKKAWAKEGKSLKVTALLASALKDFEAALPDSGAHDAIVLGNIAYANQLLGHADKATEFLQRALRRGGAQAYRAELGDMQLFPVPADLEFKAQLEELWEALTVSQDRKR